MKRTISIRTGAIMLIILTVASTVSCQNPSEITPENTVFTEPEVETTEVPQTEIEETTAEEETAPPPPYSHIEHTFADSFCTECGASEGLRYRMNEDGKSAELFYAKKAETEKIVIAESFNGYPVTRIANSTFTGMMTAKLIVIPDTVTEIGFGAFSHTGIRSISIPSGVTRIENKTFDSCRFLETVKLPDGITYIGENAFFDCRVLEAIDLPDALTEIGASCFFMCDTLTEIEIPKGVTSLPYNFIFSCSNIEKIVLHQGITELASGSLNTNGNVKEVIDFPNSLESVTDLSFPQHFPLRTEYGGCVYIGTEKNPYQILERIKDTGLTVAEIHPDTRLISPSAFRASRIQKLTIPDGVISIGYWAFVQCWELTEISIADSVSYIGNGAFENCIVLETIKLPASLKGLAANTFNDCKVLTEIVIPASVEYISERAFSGCKALKSITVPASVKKIDKNIDLPKVDIHYEGTKDEWESVNENVWQFEGCTLITKDGTFHG